jgi:hypothetical protein
MTRVADDMFRGRELSDSFADLQYDSSWDRFAERVRLSRVSIGVMSERPLFKICQTYPIFRRCERYWGIYAMVKTTLSRRTTRYRKREREHDQLNARALAGRENIRQGAYAFYFHVTSEMTACCSGPNPPECSSIACTKRGSSAEWRKL